MATSLFVRLEYNGSESFTDNGQNESLTGKMKYDDHNDNAHSQMGKSRLFFLTCPVET